MGKINLKTINQIEKLVLSDELAILFKHSTRCGVSKSILRAFESKYKRLDFYYLDILNHRDVSDALAKKLNIPHQSPQIIVIKNGKPVAHHSHYDIISKFNLEAYK